jgi:putative transcriptional regulator
MPTMKSLEGHLLVASPHLHEAKAKSVVLVLSHHDEGALGVVLNRPMGQTIDRLWPQVSPQPCTRMEPVSLGGPESGPLLALHGSREVGEHELPQGVFLAASRDHLEKLVRQRHGPLRLFIGHTRWPAGELEQELEQGVWHTLPATAQHVFSDEELLWANCLKEVGRSVLIDSLGLDRFLEDPLRN